MTSEGSVLPSEAAQTAGSVATGAPTLSAFKEKAEPYAYYALLLLTLANFFNYVDRQIVSIVAHSLQADLGFSDTQLGFLLGTAFAVLYGVFGIAMGRIADALSRTKLMAAGLAVWSGMTALSGFAMNYLGLAAARVGVGIGEATANPCSHSLLSDYFPARNRAAVIGTYLVGAHLGGAASLLLGGMVLQHWDRICLALPGNACAVADWRAAFLAVGAPGLVLAVLLAALREPPREKPPGKDSAARTIFRELSAAVPPFTVFNLLDAGGRPAALRNLGLAALLAVGAAGMVAATGDWLQWIAVGIGAYSVITWGQVLSLRDRPLFRLTFGCPIFILTMASGALISCFGGTVHAWAAPYALRELAASPGEVGLMLGLATAVSSGLSVVLGGLITDHWKRHDVRAPLWVGMIGLLASIPALFAMLTAKDLVAFAGSYFMLNLFAMAWPGGFAALVQDLVQPRMRATASAAFSLVIIVFAASMGPYWAGKISTLTGSLTTGLYSLLALAPVAVLVLLFAAARLSKETPETRRARAGDA